MGDINGFKKENLVIGVLSTAEGVEPELRAELEREFGRADLVSGEIDFTFTSYYDDEMGGNIKRWFYSFTESHRS